MKSQELGSVGVVFLDLTCLQLHAKWHLRGPIHSDYLQLPIYTMGLFYKTLHNLAVASSQPPLLPAFIVFP